MTDLPKIWQQAYTIVPQQLNRIQKVQRAVTAFNTNIDAVLKISGKKLSELAQSIGLTAKDMATSDKFLNTPKDVIRGIVRCFTQGIAEEWLCENKSLDEWMQMNLGYDRLQMGGQAGIVANVLAVLGVREVCAHTNSHPQMQAAQFLDLENLFAIDNNGIIHNAHKMFQSADELLVHRIIEFDRNDAFELDGKKYICPKSNRFIATYDTANIELKINDGFIKYVNRVGFDYMILSGYHNLTAARGGLQRIEVTLPLIQKWMKNNPHGITHLELASTQDKLVRKAVLEKLALIVDSVGLNEREALDAIEVIAPDIFEATKNKKLTASVLLEILLKLKEKLRTPRIQLHFFGMYLTLQDKSFKITPEQNKRGMMLAATIAASKAGLGHINNRENLLWAHGADVSTVAVKMLQELAEYTHCPELAQNGISTYNNMDLIAIPTIIIDKPKTLVGMGDTISSVSLVAAR